MIGKLNKKDMVALIYIALLSIIAVVYGFSIIPSPSSEQAIVADHKRVVDLAQIQASVDDYYQTNNTLPATLDEITTNLYDASTPLEKTDPQTKQPYDYTQTSPYSYKLCATFTYDSFKEQPNTYDDTISDYASYSNQFKHPAGYYCFTKSEPYSHSFPPSIIPCRGVGGAACPMMRATAPQTSNDTTPSISPTLYPVRNGSNNNL